MKTTRVNRYNCDHCGKRGYSVPHMKRHEKHCTMNPNRTCRVCVLLEEHQGPVGLLEAMLPDSGEYLMTDESGVLSFQSALTDAANAALPALREAANNCPACILAAIRQRGIPVAEVSDFDWSKEMEAVWDDMNEREAQECYHG